MPHTTLATIRAKIAEASHAMHDARRAVEAAKGEDWHKDAAKEIHKAIEAIDEARRLLRYW